MFFNLDVCVTKLLDLLLQLLDIFRSRTYYNTKSNYTFVLFFVGTTASTIRSYAMLSAKSWTVSLVSPEQYMMLQYGMSPASCSGSEGMKF